MPKLWMNRKRPSRTIFNGNIARGWDNAMLANQLDTEIGIEMEHMNDK